MIFGSVHSGWVSWGRFRGCCCWALVSCYRWQVPLDKWLQMTPDTWHLVLQSAQVKRFSDSHKRDIFYKVAWTSLLTFYPSWPLALIKVSRSNIGCLDFSGCLFCSAKWSCYIFVRKNWQAAALGPAVNRNPIVKWGKTNGQTIFTKLQQGE